MEIADHAGETNGPEPRAEETGARQGRGGLARERKLKKKVGQAEWGEEGPFRVDNRRQQ